MRYNRAVLPSTAVFTLISLALILAAAPPGTAAAHQAESHVPRALQTARHVVALTFDDGPSIYTAQILAILQTHHAHATFFVVGYEVPPNAKVLETMARDGDEIGNHTYTHPNLTWLSTSGVEAQLERTQTVVYSATFVTPCWFRPPDGSYDMTVTSAAAALGLRGVLWSVDPQDWSLPGAWAISQRVLAAVQPGSIILLHDGGGNRSETVAALPLILDGLARQGYRVETVSGLFGYPVPLPCNRARALVHFAAVGVPPAPTHAIYAAWLGDYCNGEDFGPATSPEHASKSDGVVQNFARTGHRLTWNRRTGAVHMSIVWSWPVRVFAADGIGPRWNTLITDAWFDEYFAGYDWGAAVTQPQRRHGATVQCFRRGCATSRAGHVTWVQT
jgi:peptidoglycan/xylan/chitin deacetylase (PgdA/CDA1 family)